MIIRLQVRVLLVGFGGLYMSGGKFDYLQFQIMDVAEQLGELIESTENSTPGQWNYEFSKETLDKFKECYTMLSVGGKMLHRIDWLVSGDDGEESFHRRLEEDLKNL
jgi:hypothetical protein